MIKRHIRLKELGADLDNFYTPAEAYLDACPLLDRKEIYHVRTDSEGNQVSILGNKAPRRIFLVGDSTVESLYLRASHSPHTLIERYLLAEGYDVEVRNLGVSGAQLLNIVNLVINKLGSTPGTVVVVTLPINDVGPLRFVDGYHSRHRRFASITPADADEVASRSDYDFELYRRMLDLLVSACRSLELDLVLTSVCHRGGIDRFERLNQHARAFAEKQGVPFLDLEEEQAAGAGFFYDDAHFLAPGAQHYARRVAAVLKQRLVRGGGKTLSAFPIMPTEPGSGTVSWSSQIDIGRALSIRAIIDMEQTGESENGAVLLVRYNHPPVFGPGRQPITVVANNEAYHAFHYLNAAPDKRLERVYEIPVPQNCHRLSVGIRGWRRNNIAICAAEVVTISQAAPA